MGLSGNGPDPQKPQCKKAKELRLERWRQKQTLKTGDSGEVKEVMQVDWQTLYTDTALKRNKSHGFGAMHLKELIKTNNL